MAATIDLAHAGGTTGEWAGVLREVFGEYRAPTGVGAAVGAGGGSHGLRAIAERVRALPGGPPRLLVAKPGLDGHSNGAEQIAVAARDAGLEVIYQGIRLTPEQIAAVARRGGRRRHRPVDPVGLAPRARPRRWCASCAGGGVDAPVVAGGIIPEEDRQPPARRGRGRRLHAQGLRARPHHGRARRPGRRAPRRLTGPARYRAVNIGAGAYRTRQGACGGPIDAVCWRTQPEPAARRQEVAMPVDRFDADRLMSGIVATVAVALALVLAPSPVAVPILVALAFACGRLGGRERGHRLGGRAGPSCSAGPSPSRTSCGRWPTATIRCCSWCSSWPPSRRPRSAPAYVSARCGATGRVDWTRRAGARPSAGSSSARSTSSVEVQRGGSSAPSGRPAHRTAPGVARQAGDQALHRHAVGLDDGVPRRAAAGRRTRRPCRRRARRRRGRRRTRPPPRPPCAPRRTPPCGRRSRRAAAMRPANDCRSSRPPSPISSITRRPTDSADADTATHRPSLHRQVPRGTE